MGLGQVNDMNELAAEPSTSARRQQYPLTVGQLCLLLLMVLKSILHDQISLTIAKLRLLLLHVPLVAFPPQLTLAVNHNSSFHMPRPIFLAISTTKSPPFDSNSSNSGMFKCLNHTATKVDTNLRIGSS